jgi:prepilin-type processing-associated H-X9-DG protein
MGSASWSDESGFYSKTIAPFPGSELLGAQAGIGPAALAAPAMATGVLLPALGKSREQAKRVASASNLRQVGMGIVMYASDHQGTLPANLDAIQKDYIHNPSILHSPMSNAPTGEDLVYMGNDQLQLNRLQNPSALAVAYDSAALMQGKGTNVLFLDGHVEWVEPDRFEQVMADAKGQGLVPPQR